jgi:nicotinamide N-methyltransferase
VYENIAKLDVEDCHHHHHHHPSPSSTPCQWPWSTISVRLVGSHPLWGHHLYVYRAADLNFSTPLSFSRAKNKNFFFFYDRWNAARALAGFLQRNPELYAGRTVLELGAGGGLPGLVAAKCGARKVRTLLKPD